MPKKSENRNAPGASRPADKPERSPRVAGTGAPAVLALWQDIEEICQELEGQLRRTVEMQLRVQDIRIQLRQIRQLEPLH